MNSCAIARGGGCKPLVQRHFSHFQAAREDRDGRSRYRVSKMSFLDELGWYRDHYVAPKNRGGVYFLASLVQREVARHKP